MGAAVWIDGRVVWTGSAGLRDVERGLPVDGSTIFRLASVSKVVTATAAARLVQEGKLDPDAPVSSMVPLVRSDWPKMTTRHLAAHISGLPHYQSADDDRGRMHYASVDDAVKVFAERDLLFAPGERYSYSSWGYTLLSAVVERRSGRPFLDYVTKALVPDLSLGADATGGENPHASKAYEFENSAARPAAAHDFSYTWAGGGLGATPSAIATFGGRAMSGALVSPATFAWMTTPTRLNGGTEVADEDYKVGFGWRVARDRDGERIVHHAGVAVGARSALILWPERRVTVSLLSNALWVSSIEQSAMMLAAPFKPAPPGLITAACPISATRYEGRYGDAAVQGTVRFATPGGVCTGELAADAPFRKVFDAFPQKDATALRVVGIDVTGGLSRAALVTPIGVYDLRAQADGNHRADFSAKRAVTLRFF
jgi:serine beta-lactamase-like protein LACTB, mitochondrial